MPQKKQSLALRYLCLFIILVACDASLRALTNGVRFSSLVSHFAFSTGSALVIFAIALLLSLPFGKRRLAACGVIAIALLVGLQFFGR
ncbi:MAG TPA: hypothetical protein VJ810_23625 [Blastocatellia bacterium]|nr:hypothetical protein [Blastocatellia bacterium]